MYKIKETTLFEEAVYSYDEFNMIRDAETFGDDVSFPNNTVTAINGGEFNQQVLNGIIPIENLSTRDPLNPAIMYVFRKTLAGKYLPLHVSMRPKTAANLAKGSERYGSASIDREVFGSEV